MNIFYTFIYFFSEYINIFFSDYNIHAVLMNIGNSADQLQKHCSQASEKMRNEHFTHVYLQINFAALRNTPTHTIWRWKQSSKQPAKLQYIL